MDNDDDDSCGTSTNGSVEPDISVSTLYMLLAWIGLLFTLLVILCVVIAEAQKSVQPEFHMSDTPYSPVNQTRQEVATNRMFTGYEDVDFVCISMQQRKSVYFERLRKMLADQSITLSWFPGIDGKKVDLKAYNMTPRYRSFFENNIKEREAGKTKTDYRGHFGCTLSHLGVISNIRNMTVIFEDDAEVVPDFRRKFQSALGAVTRIDPDWDVLVLGWCCEYNYHSFCKLNDTEPIQEGGVVKVHYWAGGWAYCIRGPRTAEKILKMFNPMSWHIDLTIAEAARTGRLSVYACMPTIANHAGSLRISSFDFVQKGDDKFIRSDTNG